MAAAIRHDIYRYDQEMDAVVATECVNKVADPAFSSESCVKVQHGFDLGVGIPGDKILSKTSFGFRVTTGQGCAAIIVLVGAIFR